MIKQKTTAATAGIAWRRESYLFAENIAETIRTRTKAASGKFTGVVVTTILLSYIDLIAQRTRRIRVAAIIKSCFGIMKASVAVVKNKVGRRKRLTEIIMFEAVLMYDKASFLSIDHTLTN